MFPFINQLKFIDWEEIESIHVEKYEPIKEFGGWGYRGFKDNRALNTHGNLGIRIHLKEGNKILFGTNQEVAASAAIQAHFKKH